MLLRESLFGWRSKSGCASRLAPLFRTALSTRKASPERSRGGRIRVLVRGGSEFGLDLGETLQGACRGDCSLQAYRSPKATMSRTEYCRRRRSTANCALNNSTLAARTSEISRTMSDPLWAPSAATCSSFHLEFARSSREPYWKGLRERLRPDALARWIGSSELSKIVHR